MTEVTYYVRFLAECTDCLGYTTYAFENLDYTNPRDHYLMCVRFPNWDQASFEIGDTGYLNMRRVEAGIDKWYDGEDFNFYRYTNWIFMKFILEKPMVTTSEVILD